MAGYRQSSLRCPGCAELMEAQLHGDAHLDVCPQCRGIWVDWMDGELQAIATTLAAPAKGRALDDAVGSCPHCQQTLAPEPLEATEVWRCGHCVGAFMSHEATMAIAGVAPPDPDAPTPDAPWLTRLLDRLAKLVTPG